jgi:hypothetical protein
MKAAIAKTCPEYSEEQLAERATAWVEAALKKDAIIIASAS